MKDTIAALATPPGFSAIAAARVSGPAVAAVCKAVLPGFKMQPRTAACAAAAAQGRAIDSLIAIYYPAPNSYTGEDVLELYPHGNPFIVRKLMEAICAVPGVRLAERGEFTERAFLNGKMDLTQAEAVGDVLRASDSKSLCNAQRLLSGEVSGEIKALAESIKEASARLELETDFAEDSAESIPGLAESGGLGIEKILFNLRNLKKRFKSSQSEPPRAVLFGAPNAGKSSLINALLRQERLLVSQAPGTTRDFVEVPLHLPSGDILLADTAGLASKAQSEIDALAMRKSEEALEKANLKMLIIDSSIPLPEGFEKWKSIADMAVLTHSDMPSQIPALDFPRMLKASSVKNEGIEELALALDGIFFPKEEEREEAWIMSARQIACIAKAEERAASALELLGQGAAELAAFEMREARKALCSITGEISDDSILEAIFSSYCIGK